MIRPLRFDIALMSTTATERFCVSCSLIIALIVESCLVERARTPRQLLNRGKANHFTTHGLPLQEVNNREEMFENDFSVYVLSRR